YDIVREYWRQKLGANFDQTWKQSLHDGVIANSALPPKSFALKSDLAASIKPATPGKYEIVFRIDPSVHDGRYANNSWLRKPQSRSPKSPGTISLSSARTPRTSWRYIRTKSRARASRR